MKSNKKPDSKLSSQEYKQLAVFLLIIFTLLAWVTGFIVGNRHGIQTQKNLQDFSQEPEVHNHE